MKRKQSVFEKLFVHNATWVDEHGQHPGWAHHFGRRKTCRSCERLRNVLGCQVEASKNRLAPGVGLVGLVLALAVIVVSVFVFWSRPQPEPLTAEFFLDAPNNIFVLGDGKEFQYTHQVTLRKSVAGAQKGSVLARTRPKLAEIFRKYTWESLKDEKKQWALHWEMRELLAKELGVDPKEVIIPRLVVK